MKILRATISVGELLRRSIERLKLGKNPNWRVHEQNFARKTSKRICEPGSVNFSAGWFAQGHAVSLKFLFTGITYSDIQSEQDMLSSSLNLRKQRYLGSSDWIQNSNHIERFLNLTLSLIHPELFKSGLQMLHKLRRYSGTKEVTQEWQSVYTGIGIISNRKTPSHRDRKGRPQWFDMLVSYCGTETRPRLIVKDVGLDLKYSSGTVIGFCGSILEHEVQSKGVGDRVCYAHFMREEVRDHLNVAPAGWVNQEMYLPARDAMDLD